MKPTLGRIVHYRSKTGNYWLAAIVTADAAALYRPGVEAGNLPDLDSDEHVHLAVLTPGFAGFRNPTTSAEMAEHLTARSTPAGGSYQEWNVPHDEDGSPGTWRWPPRA